MCYKIMQIQTNFELGESALESFSVIKTYLEHFYYEQRHHTQIGQMVRQTGPISRKTQYPAGSMGNETTIADQHHQQSQSRRFKHQSHCQCHSQGQFDNERDQDFHEIWSDSAEHEVSDNCFGFGIVTSGWLDSWIFRINLGNFSARNGCNAITMPRS